MCVQRMNVCIRDMYIQRMNAYIHYVSRCL